MKRKITLLAGIIAIATIVFAQSAVAQRLFINEYMASNDTALPGPEGDFPDWIEIYNPNPFPVMLGGYFISDDIADTTAWFEISSTFPDSVTVEAGGYILFYANKGDASSVLNLDFKLGSGGEQIGLWNPMYEVMDTLTYGAQTTDISEGRETDGSSTMMFFNTPDITPMATNKAIGYQDLFINEFMASNDTAFAGPEGDYPDWIEIYNPNSFPVMLGGYLMSDDITDTASWFSVSSTYPDSVTVPANGFILFYANKGHDRSVLNLDFKLSGGGEQVSVRNPQMMVIDTLTYDSQDSDTSYGRLPDGDPTWVNFSTSTPGATNSNGTVVGIIINYPVDGVVLKAYPNPVNDGLVFFNKQVNIDVYSVTGQRVMTAINVSSLNVEDFEAGLYVIQTDNGELVKLIVR